MKHLPGLVANKAASYSRRFAIALLPTAIQSRLPQAKSQDKAPERLGDTAWMDGLRGLLSILICTQHQLAPYNAAISPCFSGFRLVFFVIGGFVASHKPQKLMTAGSTSNALTGIAKSALRKPLRIFLPVFITTFAIALLTQAGAFESIRFWMAVAGAAHPPEADQYFGRRWAPWIVRKWPSIWKQLHHWLMEGLAFVNVAQTDGFAYGQFHTPWPLHNSFLWTLKSEFRASLATYMTLVICAYMKPMVRLFAWLILSQYHIYGGSWECLLFCWGAAVAQADVSFFQPARKAASAAAAAVDSNNYLPLPNGSPLTEKPVTMTWDSNEAPPRRSAIRTVLGWTIWIALFVLSVSLLSFPRELRGTHPRFWHWVRAHVPRWWSNKDYTIIGAGWSLFIVAMQTARPNSLLHRLLTNAFLRWSGTQFFGMIATHWIVLCMGGYWLHNLGWHLFGGDWRSTGPKYWIGWLFGWSVNLLLCTWAADVWTREVFRRTNRWVSMFETFISNPAPAPVKASSVVPAAPLTVALAGPSFGLALQS